MAKMGRPKSEKPLDKRVTIRLNEEEFTILVEYGSYPECPRFKSVRRHQ